MAPLTHFDVPTLDSLKRSPPHISNGETLTLTENRHQAEHQQLAEMRSRSFMRHLRAVFAAD